MKYKRFMINHVRSLLAQDTKLVSVVNDLILSAQVTALVSVIHIRTDIEQVIKQVSLVNVLGH